jgi:hypothetical protein
MSELEKVKMDLKREEMLQNREIEMRRIELEEKKWEYNKQWNSDLLKQIEEILRSADKLRGPKPVQVLCPNVACRKPFYTDGYASYVVCPHCGVTLEKSSASPPPQTQSPAEPAQAKQP